MNAKHQAIVDYRLGLVDGVQHSLKDCAELFGVTTVRVRQLETKWFIANRNARKTVETGNRPLRIYLQ